MLEHCPDDGNSWRGMTVFMLHVFVESFVKLIDWAVREMKIICEALQLGQSLQEYPAMPAPVRFRIMLGIE